MRRRRPLRLLALIAVLGLAAAACGDDDDMAADATDAQAGGDSADLGLVSDGNLTVCSDIPYEPFEFEGEDGEFTGYDIDTLREIAGRIGSLELDVRVTPFDGILGALEAGDCDAVGSALTITEERAQQVNFTEPYFDADQSLLIRAEDEATFATLDDLGGESIGVQAGTTGEAYAEENAPEGATVKAFEGAAELFAALESGDVAAILQDFPVNAGRALEVDTLVVTERFPTDEHYGFAVAKDKEALLEAMNAALAAMESDGFFDALDSEYFGDAAGE
jgi:polar amino acid transport system substrate-binding protein